jgi:hypothetical protein
MTTTWPPGWLLLGDWFQRVENRTDRFAMCLLFLGAAPIGNDQSLVVIDTKAVRPIVVEPSLSLPDQ